MLDMVGELRYYTAWRASSASRVRILASDIDPDTGLPTGKCETPRVNEIVKTIAGGPLGMAQFLKRGVECLTVPGEHYVVILATDTGERWLVLTLDEIKDRGGRSVSVLLPEGGEHEIVPGVDTMYRVWNPRPRKASEADSPVRASMASLREIVSTTKTIANASKSRLIGNGIVFVPSEMSLPASNAPTAEGGLPLEGVAAVEQIQEMLFQVAMTAYEDEHSQAALVPIFASVAGDMIGKAQHMRFDNTITDIAIKTRNDAIARLAMGLDVSPERLLGLGSNSNHWCVDTETEIYTQRGWLRELDLRVGDIALTLNHTTGMSEWQPVLDVYRAEVVDEPMRRMTTQGHNSLTTLAHRWPVLRGRGTPSKGTYRQEREWTTSDELSTPHAIITGAPHAGIPTTAKYTDAFVELVAWYWTEGSLLTSGKAVTLAQSHTVNPRRVDRIRAALVSLFGGGFSESVQANETSHGGPVTVFRLGVDQSRELLDVVRGKDKSVDHDFVRALTASQLELFIDMSCQGDGWHYRSGVLDIWQKNRAGLAAFELALILSGRAVSEHASGEGWAVRGLERTRQRPGKGTHGHRARVIEQYTGTVWCPTTPNRTWLARRNGQVFYTGNSAWQIGDEDVRLHIIPPVETICSALTDHVLRPLLVRERLDPEKFVVWYDAAPLTADPDLTDEATNAFDRGAITAEAYREFLGLGDTGYDLTTLEGWQEWARDRVSQDPDQLQKLLPLLDTVNTVIEVAPPPPPALEQPAQEPPPGQTPPVEQNPQGPPNTEQTQRPGQASLPDGVIQILAARALELAGKRRRTHADHARLRDVPMHETHRYMTPVDAADVPRLIKGWDAALEDEVLISLGFDPDTVRDEVRRQVRDELTRQMVDA